MTGARLFFVGGLFSYRALFNWISPLMYTTTMLGSPLFQLLFFTYLGRSYDASRGDLFYVVGNSIQVCAMSAIYAGTMTVANERQFGTLSALLGSPANRFLLFFGRTLPVIVNGLFVSAFAFLVGIVVIGVRFPAGSAAPLAVVLVVTVSSCTAMGMTLGSFGLRYRDVFFFSNLVYFLMLLLCGVNIPLSALPAWMQHISSVMPLTHGIEAARRIAHGASLGSVSGLVWREAAVGTAYAVLAFGLFRLFEYESRRRASLEVY